MQSMSGALVEGVQPGHDVKDFILLSNHTGLCLRMPLLRQRIPLALLGFLRSARDLECQGLGLTSSPDTQTAIRKDTM